MRLSTLLLVALAAVRASAQGVVSPEVLTTPSADSWPMHNGDYSGRRFSALTTVTSGNVGSLTKLATSMVKK